MQKYDCSIKLITEYANRIMQQKANNEKIDKNDLLKYLLFQVPYLVLDYDQLPDEFIHGDPEVVARTIVILNMVKDKLVNQRPGNPYLEFTKKYEKYIQSGKIYNLSNEDKFYQIYNPITQYSLNPCEETISIFKECYPFSDYLLANFSLNDIYHIMSLLSDSPVKLMKFLNCSQDAKDIIANNIKSILGKQYRNPRSASLDMMCALYQSYGHEILIENHFLFYLFLSLFKEFYKDSLYEGGILVDPSPIFMKKLMDNPCVKDAHFLCLFVQDGIADYFKSYCKDSNIVCVSVSELSQIHELSNIYDLNNHMIFFGNHIQDSGLKQSLSDFVFNEFDNLLDVVYFDYDFCIVGNEQLKKSVIRNKFSFDELHLLDQQLQDVKNKMPAMVLTLSKNSTVENMDVIHHVTPKSGNVQILSPERAVLNVNSDVLFDGSTKIRSLFRNNNRKGSEERTAAKLYKFTEEIYFYYTISGGDKENPRMSVYAVEPEFLIDGSRNTKAKKRIKALTKQYRTKENNEKKSPETILETIYPYEIIRNNISVHTILSEVYEKAYKKKSVTLKTFLYLEDAFLQDRLGKRQMKLIGRLAKTTLGDTLLDHINSEFLDKIVEENFEEIDQLAAKATLSYVINDAIKKGHATENLIKEEVLSEMGRPDKAFGFARKNLTHKYFSSKDNTKMYDMIVENIEKDKRYFAAYIKLLAGLESNIVLALTWGDFLCIHDYNEGQEKYQLLIHSQLCNDGSKVSSFTRKELYRRIPCSKELTNTLKSFQQKLMNEKGFHTIDEINHYSIVEGTISSKREITPENLARFCNTKLVSKMKNGASLKTILPDSNKGTIETDFMNYGGDIFKSNYEHYAKVAGSFTQGELDYLLGRQTDTPFARNYCDYENDASQIRIGIKQDRLTNIFHKKKKLTTLCGNLPDQLQKNYTSRTSEGHISELQISFRTVGATNVRIDNDYGYTLKLDKVVGGKK